MSSRSLIRALNNVFEYWESNSEQELRTSELFKTIATFHERHNTLQTITQSTNVHNELYRFYQNHIKPRSNLQREIIFVEILTELLPVLSKSEVLLWLKTYLGPAVDSGNLEHHFIDKCRKFIIKVINFKPSLDPLLNERWREIQEMVVKDIIDIYVGESYSVYEKINVVIDMHDLTDITLDRIRFINDNCVNLLVSFAVENVTSFGDIVDQYFIRPQFRLAIITMFMKVVTTRSFKLYNIINSKIFSSLFKSLLFDFDEKILVSGLQVLIMLIPIVNNKIRDHLNELFLVYVRFVLAELNIDKATLSKIVDEMYDGQWDSAYTNSSETLNGDYMVTILYGLFPYNFIKFSSDPIPYLATERLNYISPENLVDMAEEVNERYNININQLLQKITKDAISKLLIHPNLLDDTKNINTEIESCTDWLQEADCFGVEEIMIGCMKLNPNLDYEPNVDLQTLLIDHEKLYSFKESKRLLSLRSNSVDSSNSNGSKLDNDTTSLGEESNAQTLTASSINSNGSSQELDLKNMDIPGPFKLVSTNNKSLSKGHFLEVVNYYQRELLLYKNELEFTLYIKNIMKNKYLELRLEQKHHYDLLVQIAEEEKKNEVLTKDKQSWIEEYNKLNHELKEVKLNQVFDLETFQQKQSNNDKLVNDYNQAKEEQSHLQHQLDQMVAATIPNKNHEITELKNDLIHLKQQYEVLTNTMNDQKKRNANRNITQDEEDSGHNKITAFEEQILKLNTEIAILQESNRQLNHDNDEIHACLQNTITKYETQRHSNSDTIKSQITTIQFNHQKTIDELHTTILKYEALVEEKNTKIAQLTTSKPISIPDSSSNSITSRINSDGHFDNGHFEDRVMMSFNTERPSSPAKPPIIKGRGGYQKRSKKIM